MWALAAIAAGLAWRWPAAFVVLKPTLVPFALLGITRRAWWRGAALALLLAVPFAALWLDYAVALTNARNPELGLNYLLGEWPIAIGIVLAGVFSHRGSETLQMLRVPLDRKWSDPHT
jgi:hypothetical protein